MYERARSCSSPCRTPSITARRRPPRACCQVARIYGWRLFRPGGAKGGKRRSDVESVLEMEREAANGPIPSIVTTRLVESPTPTSRGSSRAADAGHTDRTDNSLVGIVLKFGGLGRRPRNSFGLRGWGCWAVGWCGWDCKKGCVCRTETGLQATRGPAKPAAARRTPAPACAPTCVQQMSPSGSSQIADFRSDMSWKDCLIDPEQVRAVQLLCPLGRRCCWDRTAGMQLGFLEGGVHRPHPRMRALCSVLLLPCADARPPAPCTCPFAQIQILRRRDGRPWVLGGGAFGQGKWVGVLVSSPPAAQLVFRGALHAESYTTVLAVCLQALRGLSALELHHLPIIRPAHALHPARPPAPACSLQGSVRRGAGGGCQGADGPERRAHVQRLCAGGAHSGWVGRFHLTGHVQAMAGCAMCLERFARARKTG